MLCISGRTRIVAITVLRADFSIASLSDELALLVDCDGSGIADGFSLCGKLFCIALIALTVYAPTCHHGEKPIDFYP